MKFVAGTPIFVLLLAAASTDAFLQPSSTSASTAFVVGQQARRQQQLNAKDGSCVVALSATAMAEAGIPPATSEASATVADTEIPTNLPSDIGKDYVPLATMLATGELAEADQVCFLREEAFGLVHGGIRNTLLSNGDQDSFLDA